MKAAFAPLDHFPSNVREIPIASERLPGVEMLFARYLGRLALQYSDDYPVLAGALKGSGVDPSGGSRCDYLEPAFKRLPIIPKLLNGSETVERDPLEGFQSFQRDRYNWLSAAVDRKD